MMMMVFTCISLYMLNYISILCKVPVIMGTNLDEGAVFVNVDPHLDAPAFEHWLNTTYGPYASSLRALYPPSRYPPSSCCSSYFYAAEHINGDFSFTCPTRRGVRWFSKTQSDTYLYYFTRVPTGAPFSYHSCEIPFVYQAQNLLLSQQDKDIAKNMATMWVQFAHGVSPSIGSVSWPRYDVNSDENLQIDTQLAITRGLHKDQCDFWDSLLSRRCD